MGRSMIDAVLRALGMAFAMGWQILLPLVLGFALSAVVQAVVSHREMARLLPDDRPRSIATALALGAASSSCSYAAVALAILNAGHLAGTLSSEKMIWLSLWRKLLIANPEQKIKIGLPILTNVPIMR